MNPAQVTLEFPRYGPGYGDGGYGDRPDDDHVTVQIASQPEQVTVTVELRSER